jgi:hypothetical protein
MVSRGERRREGEKGRMREGWRIVAYLGKIIIREQKSSRLEALGNQQVGMGRGPQVGL